MPAADRAVGVNGRSWWILTQQHVLCSGGLLLHAVHTSMGSMSMPDMDRHRFVAQTPAAPGSQHRPQLYHPLGTTMRAGFMWLGIGQEANAACF